jgi:competence protein ComEC
MLLYYFGVALVFKFLILKDRWRRAVFISTAGLLLLSVVYGMLPQPLSIHFIDVGQGDSILVSTPDRKNILIDGGGKPSSGYSRIDIGEDVLKPYLFKKRINRIDLMISTHNHEDHINGLLPVLSSFDTQMLVRSGAGNYEDLPANILPERSHIMEAYRGDTIRVGKYVTLYVLSPDGPEEVENDASLVVKLVYGDFSVLFTGDISSEVEKELLSSEIEADVIKIPHHGSATSLDELFLDGVDPEAAVICVGTNSFGHPSQETLDKIRRRGIRLYRTDKHGEITIETRGGGFSVSTCE